MINLPTVTVVAVTTKDYGPTISALLKTLEHINPKQVLYFSDIEPVQLDSRIKHVLIDRFRSVEDYNHFIFKRLGGYLDSGHVLVVQHDGYVVDGSAWREEFLLYDYIGAPWTYTDGRNVGNGGFSLRSVRLHKLLQEDQFEYTSPEDEKICRYYRQTLEHRGMIFAPDVVAHKFSYEMHPPTQPTFGFHNYFHPQWREPVVLKRSGAMGDVIMLEPVMEYFHVKGHRVILDTQAQYYNLFASHHFPIELLSNVQQREDVSTWRVINFDMGYEVTPNQLTLKSYFELAGVKDYVLRNPQLNFSTHREEVKLFDKYVIMHTDDTAMAHRNVHGLNWDSVARCCEDAGYPVFRVGRGNGFGGQKINTYSENMLAYIVANADYFIGIDSGVAQIASACGVPSMIFFGSVLASHRYHDLGAIKVMSKMCPILKDGCYHSVVSEVGKDCEVDAAHPPCIGWKSQEVVDQLKLWIK